MSHVPVVVEESTKNAVGNIDTTPYGTIMYATRLCLDETSQPPF